VKHGSGRPRPVRESDARHEADRIRAAADLVVETHRRVIEAARKRDEGRDAVDRWHEAAREAHEAVGLLYSEAFEANLERLRTGDPVAVEPAITFLEVDPWCFRSGYAKETILRFLPRAPLTEEQAERLRVVVLHAVDVGDRREFRGYGRLARHVVDDALRFELLSRMRSADPGRARRALWILEALAEEFGADDRARVLALLEAAATDARWWRVSGWVERIAHRHRDSVWSASLLDRATSDAPEAVAALRLLWAAGATPSSTQKLVLGRAVLREIESDGDSFEPVAVLADTPGLRNDLVELYRSAEDPNLRLRTWWAINAIRRSTGDDWPGDLLT
jgi:hypothetical protein